MIFIKMTCGMGNQMFMYAFARMLQEKTHQDICLDYSDFGEYSKNHNASYNNTLKNFYLKDCKVIEERREFLDLTGDQGKEYYRLKKKLDIALQVSRISGRHFIEEQFQYEWNKKGLFFGRDGYVSVYPEAVNTKNIIAKGYWQSEKYFYHIGESLKEEFKVRSALSGKNKMLYEQICETESVCVHIRRGDYVSHGKTHCTDEYYRKAIQFIIEKHPSSVFFVFSDEINYVKKMTIFSNKTIFIEEDNPPFEDLRLMSACKHFVLSNSSFSWWAQYLARYEKKIVVAPKPWYKRILTDLNQNEWFYIGVQGTEK